MRSTDYTKEDRNALAVRAQRGDEQARRELVNAMTGLVVMFAVKARAWSGGAIEAEDMKAAAWVAVFECVDRFDPSRPDADFGGMCGFWIHNKLETYAREQSSAVRAGRGRRIKRATQQIHRLVAEGEARGLTVAQALREASMQLNVSHEEASQILHGRHTVALGFSADDDGDWAGFEPVDDAPPALEAIADADAARVVRDVLASMSDEDQTLIQERVFQDLTYEQMASTRALSRERIRQKSDRALARFRAEIDRRGLDFSDLV